MLQLDLGVSRAFLEWSRHRRSSQKHNKSHKAISPSVAPKTKCTKGFEGAESSLTGNGSLSSNYKHSVSHVHFEFSKIHTSLRPIIIWLSGALGHDPSGTSVAPADSNSASSKILSGLRSTLILNPFSSNFRTTLGVNALRCSRGLVSERR